MAAGPDDRVDQHVLECHHPAVGAVARRDLRRLPGLRVAGREPGQPLVAAADPDSRVRCPPGAQPARSTGAGPWQARTGSRTGRARSPLRGGPPPAATPRPAAAGRVPPPRSAAAPTCSRRCVSWRSLRPPLRGAHHDHDVVLLSRSRSERASLRTCSDSPSPEMSASSRSCRITSRSLHTVWSSSRYPWAAATDTSVDMLEDPARDGERGAPFRRHVRVGAAEHALPQHLPPQPDRVQEGLQGYVLVHPPRRPGPDAAELVRHRLAPALQVADGDPERVSDTRYTSRSRKSSAASR